MKNNAMLAFLLFCILFNAVGQTNTVSKADFIVDSSGSPVYCFIYEANSNVHYRWGFYHQHDIRVKNSFFEENAAPKYVDGKICVDYRDSFGLWWVCLETTDTNGIRDTVCKRLLNSFSTDGVPLYLHPFFPDSKDSNEDRTFLIYPGEGKEFDLFHLWIYDRWGYKVFETKDSEEAWNGAINNNGKACPEGTYYYLLHYSYKGKSEEESPLNGTTHIFR